MGLVVVMFEVSGLHGHQLAVGYAQADQVMHGHGTGVLAGPQTEWLLTVVTDPSPTPSLAIGEYAHPSRFALTHRPDNWIVVLTSPMCAAA